MLSHHPLDSLRQFQAVFQPESYPLIALYDNLLNEFLEQFRIKFLQEIRPRVNDLYQFLRLSDGFIF